MIKYSIFILLFSLLSLPLTVHANPAAQESAKRFELVERTEKIAEFRLQNGMRLLLVPDHSAPVVTVMVLYHVGSRNEAVGYTGSTHLLEHMMFKGTPTFNRESNSQIASLLESAGADYNASTWFDRTNYFETLPADKIELALQIEADRMRNSFVKDSDRKAEMTVVRNELELGENEPSSVLDSQVYATAFREHPYHHPTIGWRSDVEGVPTSRLKTFYDSFYWPNNATLILVGDLQESAALALVDKYFGPIPASPTPIPPVYTVEPKQQGERRFILRRPGELPVIEMAWHIADGRNPDIYPTIITGALLAKGMTSRLYQALVDKQLAVSVEANVERLYDPGLCQVVATLRPGVKLSEVEQIINAEIERLKREPVSLEELRRAKTLIIAEFDYNNDGPAAVANELAEMLSNGDWHLYLKFKNGIEQVTAEQLQTIAKNYFSQDNLTVGWFEPLAGEEEKDESPQQKTTTTDGRGPVGWRRAGETRVENSPIALAPAPLSSNAGTSPAQLFVDRIKRTKLQNGTALLTLSRHTSPTVALSGSMLVGDFLDPQDRSYLANIVAEMLNKGTLRHNKIALANELEQLGATLGFSTDTFVLDIEGRFLAKDSEKVIDLLAEILRQPNFPADELDKLKQQIIAQLRQELEDPAERSYERLTQLIYLPTHPLYKRSVAERIKSVESITIKDVENFYRLHYGGASLILALAGDIDQSAIEQVVEKNFADWQGGNTKKQAIAEATLQQQSKREIIRMTEKASADIYIGHASNLRRDSSDYYAALLANRALGESTLSSRLGLQVRDTEGLTYGITSGFYGTGLADGPWAINVSVNPENIDKAIASSLDVLRKYLQEGVREKELADIKSAAIGSFKVRLSTNPGLADRLEEIEFYSLGLDFLDRYPQLINAVDKTAVDNAIRRHFHPDKVTIVIAGEVGEDKQK